MAFMVLTAFQTASAIPADPQPKKLKQPGGSYITVMMRGDEHRHMLFSEDGKPLFYNTAKRAFEYAKLQNNRLTGSGIIAKDAAQREEKARNYVKSMDVKAMEKAAMSINNVPFQPTLRRYSVPTATQGGPLRMRINDFPTIGHQKTLVILWEFSDKKFTSISNPQQFFTDLLNKPGFTYDGGINGSARDFYLDASNGLFDPEFVVVGPVTLSHEASYYGSDKPSQDAKIYEAIIESCKALDDQIDFSQYDTDNDGKVDNIYFFYAGNGQADTPNGTELIWPHSYYLGEGGWKQDLTLDGKQIDRYTCSNELRYYADGTLLPTGIGTFVHEFGHVLGLADHYDVSYGMMTFGLGSWDTMASGSYNNNMNTPPTFSAFERAELGWLNYHDLNLNADTISTLPNLVDCNKAYCVPVEGTNGREFYVMENRQKTGWDKYLPGHGMLLWHIDIDTTAWKSNTVNVQPGHQRVDIVEADGTATEATRSGDIFPGTSGITQYQLKAWDGTALYKIDDVAERNDTIRLLLAGTRYKLAAPEPVLLSDIKDSSFVATWTPVADAKSYCVSAYTTDANGQKVFLQGMNQKIYPTVDKLLIDGLTPLTDYSVEVAAKVGGYTSDTITVDAQTLPLVFAKKMPVGLNATDIQSTGFSANWNEVDGATDYLVSLYKHTYSDKSTQEGYDFSDKYDGLPELWSTNSQTYYGVKNYYGEKSPSLRLSNTNDYLIVAYPEAKIKSLNLWIRASKADAKLHVEAADGDDWKELQTIDIPTVGTTVNIEAAGAVKVRLRLERQSGFVVIDDVMATINQMERHSVENYNGVKTGGKTAYAFNGLEAGQTYSFTVRATDGTDLSYTSAECKVLLPDATGIAGIKTGNGQQPAAVYDLSGRRISNSNAAKGVYLIKRGNTVSKVRK